MKLIKPSFTIRNVNHLDKASKEIEQAARTCYKSEDKIEPGSEVELIKKLIARGHEAMLEFGPSITVLFICDRGVSHELVRHRIASFAQESTRYCDYSGDHVSFIIPEWLEIPEGDYGLENQNENGEFLYKGGEVFDIAEDSWMHMMLMAETNYKYLMKDLNWKPQQARCVLPNSLKTEINIKANIREWRHIFKLRCNKAAHPQMRELMLPLFNIFHEKAPILFRDLNNFES